MYIRHRRGGIQIYIHILQEHEISDMKSHKKNRTVEGLEKIYSRCVCERKGIDALNLIVEGYQIARPKLSPSPQRPNLLISSTRALVLPSSSH